MTRTKDRMVEHLNAPNQDAIDRLEDTRQPVSWQWRLVKAQAEMQAVAKADRVAFGNQRYAYASAEDMIAYARQALIVAGLALTRTYEMKATEIGVYVESKFSLHTVDGESIIIGQNTWPIVSQAGKGEDKAMATALTGSLAYFLRDVLLVPKEDDAQQITKAPEMDARDDRALQPAVAIGAKGAATLLQRLKSANKDLAALIDAMKRANVTVPESLEAWPKSLMPRVNAWIEKEQAPASA